MLVSVHRSQPQYFNTIPFHPHRVYPEFARYDVPLSPELNHTYEAVREVLLSQLGSNFFSGLILPGSTVVLKPNMVKECSEVNPAEWESVITHGSVIRAVCDYACLALQGSGEVIICDAPQTDSSFDEIARLNGLYEVAKACHEWSGVVVHILDLRNECWTNENGVIVKRVRLTGDPQGHLAFNLGFHSHFYEYKGEGKYYGADLDMDEVNTHHAGEKHEYLLCKTPIACDFFINIPKLKTHKKTGLTLSLKNLVGINANKNWLPHHTMGSPNDGGDQFPQDGNRSFLEGKLVVAMRSAVLSIPILGAWLSKVARKMLLMLLGDGRSTIRSGNWHGNDTTWRMVLDINRCFFYGRPDGSMGGAGDFRKQCFCLVDGIVGMERNGPMQGERKEAGLLIAGVNPVAVDTVAAQAVGIDYRKLKVISGAYETRGPYPLTPGFSTDDIEVRSNVEGFQGRFPDIYSAKKHLIRFLPHFGWMGRIEL